jgi:hypothetical protein
VYAAISAPAFDRFPEVEQAPGSTCKFRGNIPHFDVTETNYPTASTLLNHLLCNNFIAQENTASVDSEDAIPVLDTG